MRQSSPHDAVFQKGKSKTSAAIYASPENIIYKYDCFKENELNLNLRNNLS